MRKVNWLIVGIMSFVIILILFGAGTLMSAWGTMGPVGIMENWEYSSTASPLGWIGMIFMWLIPAGLIVLAVFGIVWLVEMSLTPRCHHLNAMNGYASQYAAACHFSAA
jgi:hypothetical protein